MVLYIYD
ncbi:hypothetical protein PF008_g7147, partial [Phytophthora fragariae]